MMAAHNSPSLSSQLWEGNTNERINNKRRPASISPTNTSFSHSPRLPLAVALIHRKEPLISGSLHALTFIPHAALTSSSRTWVWRGADPCMHVTKVDVRFFKGNCTPTPALIKQNIFWPIYTKTCGFFVEFHNWDPWRLGLMVVLQMCL